MSEVRHADVSAHRLTLFDRCPKALRYYNAHTRVVRRQTEAMAKGKVSHKVIERLSAARLCKGAPSATPTADEIAFAVDREAIKARLSPEAHRDVRDGLLANADMLTFGGQVVAPEFQAFVAFADDVTVEVRFDFVASVDGAIHVRDWKCGDGQPLEHEEAWHTPQVGLYLVAAHELWPEAVAWEFHLVYVRRRQATRVVWSPALDSFWRGRTVAAVRAWRAGYAPAVIGPHCGECDFRFHCQSWLEACVLRDDPTREGPVVDLDDAALLEEREFANNAEKLGRARRKDLDAEVRRRTREQMKAGGLTAAIVKRKRKAVAVEALLELAIMRDEDPVAILARAVSVSSTKALKLAQNDAERAVIARWTSEKQSKSVRVTRGRS